MTRLLTHASFLSTRRKLGSSDITPTVRKANNDLTCYKYQVTHQGLAALLWDATILIFTVWGLRLERVGQRSPLRALLLTQAVAYASLSLILCVPITVFWGVLHHTGTAVKEITLLTGICCYAHQS